LVKQTSGVLTDEIVPVEERDGELLRPAPATMSNNVSRRKAVITDDSPMPIRKNARPMKKSVGEQMFIQI
jgi:hypothetical protein